MQEYQEYIVILGVLLVSLTIHEYAHAWMAYRYGDDTAARMGRLTLNPIAHISLFGTILLPIVLHFGWAKPVPVNFMRLTKKQVFNVSAAGPASNMLLALSLTVAYHIFKPSPQSTTGLLMLLMIVLNLILAVFNLIPIPPLDGSKMVYANLKSERALRIYGEFSRYGMFVLIAFLMAGGFDLIMPVVQWLYGLLRLPPSVI